MIDTYTLPQVCNTVAPLSFQQTEQQILAFESQTNSKHKTLQQGKSNSENQSVQVDCGGTIRHSDHGDCTALAKACTLQVPQLVATLSLCQLSMHHLSECTKQHKGAMQNFLYRT